MRARAAVLGLAPVLAGAAILGLALACAEERPPAPAHPPIGPSAAWLLEPPRIGVGQITALELAVVTPPGHSVGPYAPPPAPPGLTLLASEPAQVEQQGARWIHRFRLRLRATATGAHSWPAGAIAVEAPDGDRAELALPEHPIEIVSILPEYPDRLTPFGARAPVSPAAGGPFWVPALLGAATALAGVALLALARQRRRVARAEQERPPPAHGLPAWELARSGIEAARRRPPFEAADALSLLLRRFVDRRFRAATGARTQEELTGEEPPFAARSRWPALLEILAGLDELRFRPQGDPAAREALEARLPELFERAERFIAEATPAEARR